MPSPVPPPPPPPSYQQVTMPHYYHPAGLIPPPQIYPTYYATPYTSRSRFISLVVIMSLLAVLYLTSNWAHPFVSHFEQQRLLFEQQQQQHKLGLLGPPPGGSRSASSNSNSIAATAAAAAGATSHHRKLMPSLLARPLKQAPESMRLITTDKVQQLFEVSVCVCSERLQWCVQ